MQVKFWKYFNKKDRSTARPTDQPDAVMDLSVYAPCSMTNPRFKLSVNAGRMYYCAIPQFGRYYQLTDISYEGQYQICTYEEDLAASYRYEIGETEALVVRAEFDYNADIIDRMRVVSPDDNFLHETVSPPFMKIVSGQYLIQYVGQDGFHNVWVNEKTFQDMMKSLWRSWSNLTGMTDVIASAIDPAQYIISVQKCQIGIDAWYDINSPEYVPLVLGNFPLQDDSGANLYGFSVSKQVKTVNVKIPKNPQGGFSKSELYSNYSIKIPCYGWVSLSADDLYGYDTLTIRYTVDPINGNVRIELICGGNVISEVIGKATSPYAISSANVDFGGAVMGTVNAVASIATGNILGFAGGIGSAAGSLAPTVTTRGSMGSIIGAEDDIVLLLRYKTLGDINPHDCGRPLMEVRKVRTLSGYVQCQNPAPVLSGATAPEMEAVIKLMEGGFYYE